MKKTTIRSSLMPKHHLKRLSIQQAVNYIESNWRKGESLKEIAFEFNVDAGNLDRAFRKSHCLTFKQFQREKRKAYVGQRIAEDHVLAFELASELSFSSPQAFARWVKAEFGVPFRTLKANNQ